MIRSVSSVFPSIHSSASPRLRGPCSRNTVETRKDARSNVLRYERERREHVIELGRAQAIQPGNQRLQSGVLVHLLRWARAIEECAGERDEIVERAAVPLDHRDGQPGHE